MLYIYFDYRFPYDAVFSPDPREGSTTPLSQTGAKGSNTELIVGVTVGILVLVVTAIGIGTYFLR